ncbi:MAG TPA: GrpB family protein [Sphingorhabdus sp.]|jgi:GrpB-like predicted nucleotidyltransferase (UPF0157 family)|uniref:GrpB family protein n=1 Tax=Sphingorhabdus sp. TaxID=1902408 RepID=UPI002C178D31|nr:GrpB family protein [Sphingorhabdus sp.]HMT41595.1 GrpB family protein [Sphingorhabdus sp.]HMU20692.1 GrpB family protein [Sphingorhabdus sp.]
MSESTSQEVWILPYDPAWPQLQVAEMKRIKQALGPCDIEPIGSAAIAGISGKPIIDLLIGTFSPSKEAFFEDLKKLGYKQGQAQSKEYGVSFLELVREEDKPAVHLHVAPINGPYWQAMITFRDALRSDSSLARRYEILKRNLADLHPTDLDAYAAGKSEFVRSVLGGANVR